MEATLSCNKEKHIIKALKQEIQVYLALLAASQKQQLQNEIESSSSRDLLFCASRWVRL